MQNFDPQKAMDPEAYGLDERTRAATERTNTRIDLAWWERWKNNLHANMERIRNLPKVSDSFVRWSGEKTIVAAAGPSLHENLADIARAKQSGWRIVAADRAFAPLVRAGIYPDITVSCDASEKVAAFFPEELLRDSGAFALCVITHPSVYELLACSDVHVFSCANPFSGFWQYADSQIPPGTTCLRPGFIVTFSAVDLAMWMGAKTVVTIGNDLCWRCEDDVEKPYRESRLIHLPDGRATLSAFSRAAKTFAFFPSKHPDIVFADASDGIVQGWKATTLDEVLSGDDDIPQPHATVRQAGEDKNIRRCCA